MRKPYAQMNPEEKAAYVAMLKAEYACEDSFTGVLGNKNSFFVAKPARASKPKTSGRKAVRVSA